MKTATLYLAQTQLTPAHFCVVADDGTMLWVRATMSDLDDQAALDDATPLPGETLLNTKELAS